MVKGNPGCSVGHLKALDGGQAGRHTSNKILLMPPARAGNQTHRGARQT
jgi:hypothetical protein